MQPPRSVTTQHTRTIGKIEVNPPYPASSQDTTRRTQINTGDSVCPRHGFEYPPVWIANNRGLSAVETMAVCIYSIDWQGESVGKGWFQAMHVQYHAGNTQLMETKVRFFLILVVFSLAACEAKKATPNPRVLSLTVEWEIPSMREDESALNPEDIKGYNVQYRRCGAGDMDWTPGWHPGNEITEMDFDLPRGCYEFRVNAEDSAGLNSAWSDVIRTE